MKFTKTQEKHLREYMAEMNEDGCLPVTCWTSGSGWRTSNRALPPFVKRYERKEYPESRMPAHGTPERTAYEYLKINPRKKAVLVLDREAMFDFLFEAANGKEC